MARDIRGAGNSGTPPADGTGTAGNSANGADGNGNAPVTREELEKLNSDLRAEIGRLKPGAPAPKKGNAGEESGSRADEDNSPIGKTLRERLAQLEEREENQKKKAIRLSIRDALKQKGADPALAEIAVASILENEGERFAVTETKFGDYQVKYGESDVADWAKAFLSSPSGKRLISATAAPSVDMPHGDGTRLAAGVRLVPGSLAHTVSDEDLRSGKVAIVAG